MRRMPLLLVLLALVACKQQPPQRSTPDTVPCATAKINLGMAKAKLEECHKDIRRFHAQFVESCNMSGYDGKSLTELDKCADAQCSQANEPVKIYEERVEVLCRMNGKPMASR